MMAAPWLLVEQSDTSQNLVILFDLLLAIHIAGMLWPKRYAITRTHLFADGQRFEWNNLRIPDKQKAQRIILHRKGWGIFAPLPLGGNPTDLSIAKEWIVVAMIGEDTWERYKLESISQEE